MTPRKLANTLLKVGGLWQIITHAPGAVMMSCYAASWLFSDDKIKSAASDGLWMNVAVNAAQIIIGVVLLTQSRSIAAKILPAEQGDTQPA